MIDIDTSIYVNEIERRGGETTIFSTPYGCGRSKGFNIPLQCVNTTDGGLVLLRAEGWRFYSRNFGVRKASIAYLCGSDDNGPWAVRGSHYVPHCLLRVPVRYYRAPPRYVRGWRLRPWPPWAIICPPAFLPRMPTSVLSFATK